MKMRKVNLFVVLTYALTLVFYWILEVNGGINNPMTFNLLGVAMFIPLVTFIFVQKIIYKGKLRGYFNSEFKVNKWILLAVIIPVAYSIVLNAINFLLYDVTIFSWKELLFNILIGLTIASFSAIIEEYAWRGFLYKELLQYGVMKTIIIVSIIWALWHTPVAIIYKYPNTPIKGMIFNFIIMFVLSLIICYIREKTKSIWHISIMHGLFNSLLLGEIMNDFDLLFYKILIGIFIILIFIIYEYRNDKLRKVLRGEC